MIQDQCATDLYEATASPVPPPPSPSLPLSPPPHLVLL